LGTTRLAVGLDSNDDDDDCRCCNGLGNDEMSSTSAVDFASLRAALPVVSVSMIPEHLFKLQIIQGAPLLLLRCCLSSGSSSSAHRSVQAAQHKQALPVGDNDVVDLWRRRRRFSPRQWFTQTADQAPTSTTERRGLSIPHAPSCYDNEWGRAAMNGLTRQSMGPRLGAFAGRWPNGMPRLVRGVIGAIFPSVVYRDRVTNEVLLVNVRFIGNSPIGRWAFSVASGPRRGRRRFLDEA
jgi:hypothetical protein